MKKSITVFLIDDSAVNRNLFRQILNIIDDSINYIYVAHGQAAIKYFKVLDVLNIQIPDFIFLDLNMSGMSGMTCLKELRKIKTIDHVPCIVYSDSDPKTYRDEAIVNGADDCLPKPVNILASCYAIATILHATKYLSTHSE